MNKELSGRLTRDSRPTSLLIAGSLSTSLSATRNLSVLTRPHARLHILRDGPHLIPPSVLADQILPIAVANLRHVYRLALRSNLTFKASVRITTAVAACHKAVRDRIADEDCEAGAHDHEECDQYPVLAHCVGLVGVAI